MHVPRYIVPEVRSLLRQRPVVIIEGARAVGKTSLLGALAEQHDIRQVVSLTDPATLRAAQDQPMSWLRGLQQPFAIDEAQLAPDLPLALKSALDETGDALRCVLTGSASIGRTGLGGSDPLARRSAWLTLEPLSEAEISSSGEPWSVIDLMFESAPRIGASPDGEDWTLHARRGGMPAYRLAPEGLRRGMEKRILEDLASVLTERVLPDERLDLRIARDVLLRVLRHPAGELKVDPIGDALDLHRATVNRYLDILERRFLITELPNLRRPSKQGSRATAKVYPGDTALSAAALAASRTSADSDAARGGLMEAHVVQQLRAHLGWARSDVDLLHWRETRQGRTVEVDIVLRDVEGRLVAIEVKSGTSARPDDLRGIRALREQRPDAFHRGYVISGGGAVTPLDDEGQLWRIPVSALSDPDAWSDRAASGTAPSTDMTTRRIAPILPEATMDPTPPIAIFMSYAHKDQESAAGGDLRQFSDDVRDELLGAHEHSARIIVDEKDVLWGESLWERLHQEIDSSIYFLPFITPRYLGSDACRREFEQFDAATGAQDTERRILPLIWIEPRALHRLHDADPVVGRIRSLKYLDVTGVRHADRNSTEYRRAVAEVAEQLAAVIDAHQHSLAERVPEGSPSGEGASGSPDGFLEVASRIEETGPTLQRELEEMMESLSTVAGLVSEGLGAPSSNPTAMRRAMETLAETLEEPSALLERSALAAQERWRSLLTDLATMTRLSEAMGQSMPTDVREEFSQLSQQLGDIEELSMMRTFAITLPQMHSGLAPTSRAMLAAVRTIDGMRDGFSAAPGLD